MTTALAGLGTAAISSSALAAENAEGKEISFSQKIPVKYEVDVFVAGGGPAGISSAVTAANSGAKVFLAEAVSSFGGMGTGGRVPVFTQMTDAFSPRTEARKIYNDTIWTEPKDGTHFLCGGFGRKLVDTLAKERRYAGPCIDVEALKRVYDGFAQESGIGFSFYTRLIAADAKGGKINYVVCAAPSGIFAVKAKVYIDATGNGDLAAMANAKFEKGDASGKLMPGSLMSLWTDINWDEWDKVRPDIAHHTQAYKLKEAFESGIFTVKDPHMTGIHRLGKTYGVGNIGHTFNLDATDEVSITKALLSARKSMPEFENYYNTYIKGFENAKVIDTANLLGIRETRRIIGEYVLNIEDYKKRAVFDDEIGRYCYPIDIHPSDTDAKSLAQHRKEFDQVYKYKDGESYGIPYRILTPQGFDNLLIAGRCVSADQLVHGSIRVMPACFITGQAAGYAAAMSADENKSVRKINVKVLQKKIISDGGYILAKI